MSLFESDQGVTEDRYVIDTSSLVLIGTLENKEKVWELIFTLISAGRIKTVARVMEEFEDVDPGGYLKLKPYAARVVVHDSAELVKEAGRLTRLYPQTCGARGAHPGPADPYVIALAKINGHIVVTDERLKRRKMPKICEKEGVVSKNLDQLIRKELK